MALADFGQLLRQTRALSRKNLLVVVARRPTAFLLLTYGVPLAILAVLLSIPSFVASRNVFAVGVLASPSQFGICPQRNILWDELTVAEHVSIWSCIKTGQKSSQELDQLIPTCDLGLKRNRMAKTLSGGLKRKLQLACMFVGDSSVSSMNAPLTWTGYHVASSGRFS